MKSGSMEVIVKNSGKTFPVQVDVNGSASEFKNSISTSTGVPLERMKVMVKGGFLKDDADLTKLNLKPQQVITVIGSAAAPVAAPVGKAIEDEDMEDGDQTDGVRDPPGLVNLGQTCYLNSSLQALRQIPQLQLALNEHKPNSNAVEARFTTSMRNLFSGMKQTDTAVAPFALLNELRTLAPQFAERDERGLGFAQQDADEAWTQIISALRAALPSSGARGSFIDAYMSIEMAKTLKCIESDEEAPSTTTESVLKLECNISITTNFLLAGIQDSLNQQLEKNSSVLGRTAQYEQKTRVSRLPEYLAVHMVRFYWRRDIQKKAKIMRKVKFPLQLDVSDIVTDDLRKQVQPVNTALKNIMQGRDDRAKEIKNLRGRKPVDEAAEKEARSKEQEEYAKSAPDIEAGTNPSSMYELCALVTHKGASADSGHYIGWARNDDGPSVPSGEEEWYKYDDDKVSTVNTEKILSMDGGGQDSVAYILLYRALRP